ncbi:ubiquitin-like protein ISG15 [Pelodiscus sinensis]|uniref:ubiquitin-like protein ISG15 n=1 Tax=Pelodiscus sinensis TaxID=13735 RepID=UPI003F6D4372
MALSLRVTLLTGETHTVAASGATPLAAFKAQLARQTGVPAAQQRLACPDGVELRDGSRLADYPLAPGDTVLLMVRREEPCPVFVKNPKGRTSTYSVLPSEGVASFRARVQRQENVDAGQFWLSLEGKPLEDGHTLGDYGVAPHCTIFLHLRLRGGPSPTEWSCLPAPFLGSDLDFVATPPSPSCGLVEGGPLEVRGGAVPGSDTYGVRRGHRERVLPPAPPPPSVRHAPAGPGGQPKTGLENVVEISPIASLSSYMGTRTS